MTIDDVNYYYNCNDKIIVVGEKTARCFSEYDYSLSISIQLAKGAMPGIIIKDRIVFSAGDLVIYQNGLFKKIKGDFNTIYAHAITECQIFCSIANPKRFIIYDICQESFFEIQRQFIPSLFIDLKHFVAWRGSLLFLVDIELNKIWELDLSNLKKEVTVWEKMEDKITVKSHIVRWNDNLILSIGPTFEQRMVSISCITGQVNWISKEYNVANQFYIKDDFVYIHYYDKIIKTSCFDGSSIMYKITEELKKYKFDPICDFSMSEDYIISVDNRKLQFGLLNINTMKYDFFHQFEKGKDIDEDVWQIYTPTYYKNKIYVLDSKGILHILEFNK